MRNVTPDTVTTLVTNKYQMAIAFTTARATLRHLINGSFLGVDASGYSYSWNGVSINIDQPANLLNWSTHNLIYHEDQPVLRSAGNGTPVNWEIPTTAICTDYFGYRPRSAGDKVNIRKLYRYYKGICQLCLRHGSIGDMTIDHVYPKSLGGTNHDFNLVLAHRSCNHAKGAQTPFLNAEGQEVKGRPILRTGVMMPDIPMRDEWKAYMGLS